jgi:hypothetical protein
MPTANSGASSPSSVAATASVRMGDMDRRKGQRLRPEKPNFRVPDITSQSLPILRVWRVYGLRS